MVLDNVDNNHIFFSGEEPNGKTPLVNCLPQVAHGFILITLQNWLAARNLVEIPSHMINIKPITKEESLALLRARNPTSQLAVNNKNALVQALEYIPLAITQAGSYIANRSPRIMVSRYLQLFQESELNQTHLLQHKDTKDLQRDPSIRHAVITPW
jgi:hypothetical protein